MTKCCTLISQFSFLLEEKLVIDFSDVIETSSHFILRLDTNLQAFHTSQDVSRCWCFHVEVRIQHEHSIA